MGESPVEKGIGSRSALKARLYQEMLHCIVDGVPLPHPTVYSRAWHRDAAMMALVLARTGEMDRISRWAASLTDPFDRNNSGVEEPDNLGQCLLIASLSGGADVPIVEAVLKELPRRLNEDGFLTGLTDFGPKPVYQMKWLKFGLKSLNLPDPYEIPAVYDPYSALFWMDFKGQHVPGPPVIVGCEDYPYLQWAEAHFWGWEPPFHLLAEGEWLTWEANASNADYSAVGGEQRCAPHSWHAAEAWLYLDDLEKQSEN